MTKASVREITSPYLDHIKEPDILDLETFFSQLLFKESSAQKAKENLGLFVEQLKKFIQLSAVTRTSYLKSFNPISSEVLDYKQKIETSEEILKELEYLDETEKNKVRQDHYKEFIEGMTVPKAEDISANMMWIYDVPGERHYIFPELYERSGVNINVFDRINDWANHYNVTFWYDSKMITNAKQALSNTQEKIETLPNKSNIQLKDIRGLSLVINNEQTYSEKIPVYFRSDKGRIDATYETLINEQNPHYFMYADFKMGPIPYKDLMDNETIYNLNTYGIVMARTYSTHFENGFHIIGNNKENLLTAINLGLININNERVKNNSIRDPKKLEQIVYTSFLPMFAAFYALENKAEMYIGWNLFDHGVVNSFNQAQNSEEQKEILNKWFFGDIYKSNANPAYKLKVLKSKFKETNVSPVTSGKMSLGNNIIIPTKFWNFPKSHFLGG